MNDAPPNQPLSKYGGASPSNTAAANRSLATAAQRKDFQNTNSTPNSENIAKAVGDKAAIATITGRTLMPKSTTDSELNASLDAYEKSVSNDTISSPEEKTATLDRIRKYRQDPKHREILRISQNNNNENSLTAVTEQLKVYTKQSIISALFENKMKDGPGKTSQRPKSFGKGGKSGTEQTQARREGKRQAQEHD
jgi:hypothetical protein